MQRHLPRLALAALVLAACGPRQPASGAPPTPTPTHVEIPPPAPSAAHDEHADAPVDDAVPAPSRSTVTPSGLRIEVLREGSGPGVEPGRRVRLHYVGTLLDGSVFDSSRERGAPTEFFIGKGQLIKGFEEGVAGMRVGEVRRLTIPPELGYGSRAVSPKIPANSTLVFEVELIEVL